MSVGGGWDGAGRSDPRAKQLFSDDPFERGRGGHYQQQPLFAQFLFNLQPEPVPLHRGSLFHFSRTEMRHLAIATGAFLLALGFMRAGGMGGLITYGIAQWLLLIVISIPLMLVSVAPSFILHELAHKVMARKYGCWAEFRADPKGLQFGLLISFVAGVLFMAPGAVMVAGSVTRKENGHIAVAGPLTNLALLVIGIVGGGMLLGFTGAVTKDTVMLDENGFHLGPLLQQLVFFWIMTNMILGLFNMLPFGPLDGKKVKDWSPKAFWVTILVFIVPVVGQLFLGRGPLDITYFIADLIG